MSAEGTGAGRPRTAYPGAGPRPDPGADPSADISAGPGAPDVGTDRTADRTGEADVVRRPRAHLAPALVGLAALLAAEDRPAGTDPVGEPDEESSLLRAAARRVGCPWCSAAAGDACVVRGSGRRLRRVPAHDSRLRAAGLAAPRAG